MAASFPVAGLLGPVLTWTLVSCAIPAHEITSLPGYPKPLPTKQFSGYLNPAGSTTKYYHYWFVESHNNPAKDPVILWLNGGPGCSSLGGYFNELGPLHFDRVSILHPENLIDNYYSWNRIANLIFLESPVGVGFSYSTNILDLTTDDQQTALDNYNVLISFFKAYPEYQKNEFYLAGESYAGIYIPMLANLISKSTEMTINLKGFMVGNGCIGNSVGSCSQGEGTKLHMEFYHTHALISDIAYKDIVNNCSDYSPLTLECAVAIAVATHPIGNVNIYNLYGPCYNIYNMSARRPISRTRNLLPKGLFRWAHKNQLGPVDCIDDHVERTYFDNSTVRKAIHVESINVTGSWRECVDDIGYNRTMDSLLNIYPTLIHKYRVLIYNGDVDGCVPYTGDQIWTSSLGLPVKEPWRSWSVDDQVAGYVTEYAVNGFKFVTVKGAGHMVPQFRPKQAYAMFEHFIKQTPF